MLQTSKILADMNEVFQRRFGILNSIIFQNPKINVPDSSPKRLKKFGILLGFTKSYEKCPEYMTMGRTAAKQGRDPIVQAL